MARVARLLALLSLVLFAPTAGADPVAIVAVPVPLERSDLPSTSVGRLVYRGGIELTSPDKRFGGFSGLWVAPDGKRLMAVSDFGDWLTLALSYDARGWLVGAAEGEMGRLKDLDGKPLAARPSDVDAESLTRLADGSLLVSFERRHRLWLYPPSEPPFARAPRALATPPGLYDAPSNEGIEAMAELPDGRLLAIAEGLAHGEAGLAAWIGDGTTWARLGFEIHGSYRPTDAKALPDGDVLVLERRFNPIAGVGARLRRVPKAEIVAGGTMVGEGLAELVPPLAVDNMEGLAVRRREGEWLVYLLSDDNFQSIQRTILLLFALPD